MPYVDDGKTYYQMSSDPIYYLTVSDEAEAEFEGWWGASTFHLQDGCLYSDYNWDPLSSWLDGDPLLWFTETNGYHVLQVQFTS